MLLHKPLVERDQIVVIGDVPVRDRAVRGMAERAVIVLFIWFHRERPLRQICGKRPVAVGALVIEIRKHRETPALRCAHRMFPQKTHRIVKVLAAEQHFVFHHRFDAGKVRLIRERKQFVDRDAKMRAQRRQYGDIRHGCARLPFADRLRGDAERIGKLLLRHVVPEPLCTNLLSDFDHFVVPSLSIPVYDGAPGRRQRFAVERTRTAVERRTVENRQQPQMTWFQMIDSALPPNGGRALGSLGSFGGLSLMARVWRR